MHFSKNSATKAARKFKNYKYTNEKHCGMLFRYVEETKKKNDNSRYLFVPRVAFKRV